MATKKTTTKAEPAAKKATAAPAPKKVVKKTASEPATTPAPDKELKNAEVTIPLKDHESAIKKWNETARKLQAEINQLKEKASNTVHDVSDFGEKVNKEGQRKWVAVVLAFLLFIAIGWAVVKTIQYKNAQETIDLSERVIESLKGELQSAEKDRRADSMQNSVKDIKPLNPTVDVKKNNSNQ